MTREQDEAGMASDMLDVLGEDLAIEIAPDATLKARIRVRGRRNRLVIGAGVVIGPATSASDPDETAAIIIDGDDNLVLLGEGTVLGLRLVVRGCGHRVEIGARCALHGRANLLGGRSSLLVGAGSTMVEASLQLHEAGEVRIGEDCMISSQVYVSLSDMHPIYDRSNGHRINPAASVHIGDHVWLGLRCMILKGAEIGDGVVVAAGALVVGKVPGDAVVAGVPAKVVRRNIEWRRDFAEGAPDPQRDIRQRRHKLTLPWTRPRQPVG